ncbi:hypothetical protein [Atlanticothrix silvestris]|nr:hypothetical protein [Atlanticothrix silvestris]
MAALLGLAFIVVADTPKTRRNQWQFKFPEFQAYAPRTSTTRKYKLRTPPRRPARAPRYTNNRNVSPREWAELLALLQNDVATANRLIDSERRRHPDRSPEWAVEKALWQLKRDRR